MAEPTHCPTCQSTAGHRGWCSTAQAMRASGPVPVAAPAQQPPRPALEAFSRAVRTRLGEVARPNVSGVLTALREAERLLPSLEVADPESIDACVCALWDRALMAARVATRVGAYAEAQELIRIAERLSVTDLYLQLPRAQQRLNEAVKGAA